MLTKEQFAALEPGDTWDAGTPLQGLTDEMIVFEVIVVDPAERSALITGTYLGVRIGDWLVRDTNGTLDWERQ